MRPQRSRKTVLKVSWEFLAQGPEDLARSSACCLCRFFVKLLLIGFPSRELPLCELEFLEKLECI